MNHSRRFSTSGTTLSTTSSCSARGSSSPSQSSSINPLRRRMLTSTSTFPRRGPWRTSAIWSSRARGWTSRLKKCRSICLWSGFLCWLCPRRRIVSSRFSANLIVRILLLSRIFWQFQRNRLHFSRFFLFFWFFSKRRMRMTPRSGRLICSARSTTTTSWTSSTSKRRKWKKGICWPPRITIPTERLKVKKLSKAKLAVQKKAKSKNLKMISWRGWRVYEALILLFRRLIYLAKGGNQEQEVDFGIFFEEKR